MHEHDGYRSHKGQVVGHHVLCTTYLIKIEIQEFMIVPKSNIPTVSTRIAANKKSMGDLVSLHEFVVTPNTCPFAFSVLSVAPRTFSLNTSDGFWTAVTGDPTFIQSV